MAWSENPIGRRGLAAVDGTLAGDEPVYGWRRRGGAGETVREIHRSPPTTETQHVRGIILPAQGAGGAAVKCLREGLRPERPSSTHTTRCGGSVQTAIRR